MIVVDKGHGKFKEVTTIGVAKDEEEASNLARKAHVWIEKYKGQLILDFDETDKVLLEAKATISRVERTLQNMHQTILNRVFDEIGLMQSATTFFATSLWLVSVSR